MLPPLKSIRWLATVAHPYGLELAGTPPSLVLDPLDGMTGTSVRCPLNTGKVLPSPKLIRPLFPVLMELTKLSTETNRSFLVAECPQESMILDVPMGALLENPVLLCSATMHLALEIPRGVFPVSVGNAPQAAQLSVHSGLMIR